MMVAAFTPDQPRRCLGLDGVQIDAASAGEAGQRGGKTVGVGRGHQFLGVGPGPWPTEFSLGRGIRMQGSARSVDRPAEALPPYGCRGFEMTHQLRTSWAS